MSDDNTADSGLPDVELPGMWESADFEGGREVVRPPSDQNAAVRAALAKLQADFGTVPVADPVPAPTVDLDAALHRERIASEYVGELCSGARRWRMRVPVDPRDTDIVLSASLADVPALVAELSVLRAREAKVRELCEPKPAKQDDQCRNCGDRRLHHRPGTCGLCRFCGGFATRLPLIAADRLLAVLDGTTGSGKTG